MASTLRLSNSEMSAFRRCSRKWYLGHYRRLKKRTDDEPGSALSIGNFVHDALAKYYDPSPEYSGFDPINWMETTIAQDIEVVPQWEKDIRKEGELCLAMVSGYLEWLQETGADSDLRIDGSESKVEIPLRNGRTGEPLGVNLISKLDAPVTRISDGSRLALEHKTVQSLSQPLGLLKLDTQLLTEHLVRFLHAIEAGVPEDEAYDQCHGILYNMLRKVKRTAAAKPPFYDRVDVPHNINELRNHWRHVVSYAAQIREATDRLDAGQGHHAVCPPSPRKECTWDCPFFQVCVMADDGSDFEGALGALFEEHDPLERYIDAEAL